MMLIILKLLRVQWELAYGANAVSGVLNIITKKSSKYKWGIKALQFRKKQLEMNILFLTKDVIFNL